MKTEEYTSSGIQVGYKVSVKPNYIEPFMTELGVTPEAVYPVIGVMYDRLLLDMGSQFLEVYPRKVVIKEKPE